MDKTQKTGLNFFSYDFVDQYQSWLLPAVLCFAVVLRFYKLGEWSLWGDEMITVDRALDIFDLNPSRYSVSLVLTHFALNWMGIKEWSARLAPTLIGIATIPAIYFPTRRLFGPSVALLTGLFLAISPWHLYWSQSARFYTAILLFYTLALFAFYFGIEKDRPSYLILSLVLFGLALQERMFALFLAPVIAAYLILIKILPFEKPPGLNLRNVLILLFPSLAGAVLVSWVYIRDPSRWLLSFGWVNNNPFWVMSGIVFYVGLPVICMATVGAILLLLRKNRAALLISLAAVVPLIPVLTLSLVQYSANRYVFVSLTSWLILASVAVREIFIRIQDSGRILALGVFLIMFLHPVSEDVLYYKYQHGNRDNWKAAYAFVQERKIPGDLVITSSRKLGDFYLQEPTVGIASLKPDDLEDNGQRIWFIEDLNVEQKWPWVHKWIDNNAKLVANFDNHVQARNFKMRVYLYNPDGSMIFEP